MHKIKVPQLLRPQPPSQANSLSRSFSPSPLSAHSSSLAFFSVSGNAPATLAVLWIRRAQRSPRPITTTHMSPFSLQAEVMAPWTLESSPPPIVRPKSTSNRKMFWVASSCRSWKRKRRMARRRKRKMTMMRRTAWAWMKEGRQAFKRWLWRPGRSWLQWMRDWRTFIKKWTRSRRCRSRRFLRVYTWHRLVRKQKTSIKNSRSTTADDLLPPQLKN